MRNPAGAVAWLTFTFPMVLVGCAAPGERAGTCGLFCPETRCPSGESCSTDTPLGLYFGGDGTERPEVTAVGGRQTLTIYEGEHGAELTRPFDASSTDPSLRVVSIRAPRVTLEAVTSGSAYLRILKPGTEFLYDRIALEAANLQGAALRVEGAVDDHWALFAGHSTQLLVWLHDERGRRLVDNATRIAVDPASEVRAGASHHGWGELNVTAASTGTLRWIVVAGVAMGQAISTRVVDSIDDVLVASAGQVSDAGPGRSRQYACFRAFHGLDVVSMHSWNFSTTGGAVTVSLVLDNCAFFDWRLDTPATLTASVEGFAKTFALPIAGPSSPRSDVIGISSQTGSQAGERAQTL